MAQFESVVPDGQRHVYDDWHISPAVKVGPFVVCSGVLGIRPDGSIPEDATEQFAIAFENLRELLGAATATLSDVFELVTFHTELDPYIQAFSEVKDRFIGQPYPAWTAIGVREIGGGTLPGLLVEIKATAYVTAT